LSKSKPIVSQISNCKAVNDIEGISLVNVYKPLNAKQIESTPSLQLPDMYRILYICRKFQLSK